MAAEALIVEDAYQRGYADAIADMRKKKEQRRQREQAKNSCNYSDTGRVCKLERLAQGKRQNEKGVQKRQLCYEPVHF